MTDFSFEIMIAVCLIILGLVSIVRKRISIGLGRPRPLVDATLTNNRAISFGVVSLIVGSIPIAVILYARFTQDETLVKQGILNVIVSYGAGVVVITFLFELFVEFLVNLKANAKK